MADAPLRIEIFNDGESRLMRLTVNMLLRAGFEVLLKKGQTEQQMAMPTRGVQMPVTVEIK